MAKPNSRAGMNPLHWADLTKAMMKLTDDFDTNQYMFGWVVGANLLNSRPEDMSIKFQDGFTDGREAVDAALGRYHRENHGKELVAKAKQAPRATDS